MARCFAIFLLALIAVASGPAVSRAEAPDSWTVYTHPHLHFTVKIPPRLLASDMLEYLDAYAPSVDAAWLFPDKPARITLGAFSGLGPFDLKTMARWPGRKQVISLPAGVTAFEQVSLVEKQFAIDIYIPHEASGHLVQFTFAATVGRRKGRGKIAAIERQFEQEIELFRAVCQSYALNGPPHPGKP